MRLSPRVLCLRPIFFAAVSLVPLVLAFGACSGDTSGDTAGGLGGAVGKGGNSGDGSPDAAAVCKTSADCKGGVCINGTCCASAADKCGSTCCNGGAVCLFDQCVVPGAECHSAKDCQPGQYCETGLGKQSDAGTGGAPSNDGSGPLCTQPPPLDGRCIDLPPTCTDDAGSSDGGCIPVCEYHPPVGQLDAVVQWSWGPTATEFPDFTDIWSTPVVGRMYDDNCDGKVDELDSPDIVFVSGNVAPSNSPRDNGVLRMLDGSTGKEIWSLRSATPSSKGFMGFSTAIGDVNGDGKIEIVAATGEGAVVVIDGSGNLVASADQGIPGALTTGWGGGFAIADMDGDGKPEVAFGAMVWEMAGGALTHKWTGANGDGGGADQQLSTFVDLDGAADQKLELLAGNTAYKSDGSELWHNANVPNGFPGVGDFDKDGKPEAVDVANGQVWILEGATGQIELGPVSLPGTGSGGPPTVADFDGDGNPEIGVAMATYYSVVKPDYAGSKIDVLWKTPNHDLSSSVTGSTVFDFEGDGRAEVIYGDECFLWVFDGQTGAVRFAAPRLSFTATEASMLADVDGDGHAEIVLISNGASPTGWGCLDGSGNPTSVNGVTWTPGPANNAWRGMSVYGDRSNGWVGTRTLWSEHTYHVTNICDDHDSACDPPNTYGSIPKHEKQNWTLPWLNDFRQNVQDKGIFDAPDATVSLKVQCSNPVIVEVGVRNSGFATLPPGVDVGIYIDPNGANTLVAQTQTTHTLGPGQTEIIQVTVPAGQASSSNTFIARIIIDPANPKFHECKDDNDSSKPVKPSCTQ